MRNSKFKYREKWKLDIGILFKRVGEQEMAEGRKGGKSLLGVTVGYNEVKTIIAHG